MKLAKPALDIGLYTNRIDAMLNFWQTVVGLPFQELLPVGGGLHQHRHAIGDSVLKINHPRDGAPEGSPTGLKRLTIYTREATEETELSDPDGNEIVVRPSDGERNLSLSMEVNDVERTLDFYHRILALPADGPSGVRVGRSSIEFASGFRAPFAREGTGYRYMTVQVYDVNETHAAVLAAGGAEGMAPVTLGQVARISFVKDPDGNWIELSQRRSLVGSLD